MNSAKQWERLAAPATNLLCLLCLLGIWALISLPKHSLQTNLASAQRLVATQTLPIMDNAAPRPKAKLPTLAKTARNHQAITALNHWVNAQPTKVDPALIYAIIRQESRFNTNARSSAGALGLMQIMPDTAKYIIKLYRLNEIKVAALELPKLPKPISASRLNVPQVNLTVGQHYLKYLSEKSYIEGNLIYILTAYNAGPGNLIRFQKRFAGVNNPNQFMHRIPFKETRHYVQKVMRNYIAYQKQFYGYSKAEQQLAQGIWPTL